MQKESVDLYDFVNKIHQKTTRKSCGGGRVWNIFFFTTRPEGSTKNLYAIGKCRFYTTFTQDHTKNLVVGVGYGIFLFSPQDPEIHHKIF